MTWNGQLQPLRNLPSKPAEYVLADVLRWDGNIENDAFLVVVPDELAERLEKAYQAAFARE